VKGNIFEVIGEGAGTVVNGNKISYTNVPIPAEDHIALANIILHTLPAGYNFNLATREIILPEPIGQHAKKHRTASTAG
jgi:cyanophycinase